MNSATSIPRIIGLTLAFAAGAGATFWLTKQPEPQQKPARAQSAKAVPERVTQVSAAAPQSSSGTAHPRPPGVDARDLLSSSVPSRHAMEREGWDLAGVGIEAAMSRLAQLTGAQDAQKRRDFLRGMFEQLAYARTATEALAVLKRLPKNADREPALTGLMRGWKRNPDMVQVHGNLGLAGTAGLYLLKDRSSGVSPLQVADFAREFLQGSQRAALLAEAAADLATTDPVRAFALGNDLTGEQQMLFMHRFADGWAMQDPEAAMKWAATVPDAVTRAALQATIISAEAEKHPAQAAQHILALPAGTPARSEAMQDLARSWAAKDTRAAIQWAEGLANEADRAAAQAGVRAAAPVGIGAALTTQDGLPVINALMDGSPAKLAGTLQKGDQILAVSNGQGQWVDARQAELAEVVSLIRGEAGSAVSLRIQPADGSAARVITITRQQIMMKEPNTRLQ